jgi:ABC-2 type transport system ATP-binding protein
LSNDAAINVKNLVKQYGDLTAVNDISFDVKRGEIFAFLGPNGAGKTTTVEILVGLRKPTSGGANVLGFDIAKDREKIKKRIGVLPQSFNTYDRLTVKENIKYFAGLFDSSPDVDG